MITVFMDAPDGGITTLYPRENRAMANPSPNRVKLVKANVERLQASLLRLHNQCGHWSMEMGLEIDRSSIALAALLRRIETLPAEYVPPRKAPVRAYTTLKIGDHVKVTDRAAKHTPKTLVGCAMEIVDFEDDIAHVRKDGVTWAVQRSALKLAGE